MSETMQQWSPPSKFSNPLDTYLACLEAILKAQTDGYTLYGSVGEFRFNSADPHAPHDMLKLVHKIRDEFRSASTAFKILENKVRDGHINAPVPLRKDPEMTRNLRAELWDKLANIILIRD